MLDISRRSLLAASLLLPAVRQARAQPAEMEDRLGGILADAVREGHVVGAVLLVLRGGAELHADIAGTMDRERDIAVRRDTVFRLASMTKPIVSATAMVLVDAGLLSLDDAVTQYLPSFRPRMPDGSQPVITIRNLMTHTAGLSYGFLQPPDSAYARAGVSDGLDQPALTLAENLERLASVPLLQAPGTTFSYSLATDVLGAVLQVVEDAPLADVVRVHLTDPLEMADTTFVAAGPERLATPYTNAEKLRPVDSPDAIPFGAGVLRLDPRRALAETAYPSGGAGMVGTVDDYARFLEALRKGGVPLMREPAVRLMLTDALPGMTVDLAGPGGGYGLGVSVVRDRAASQAGLPAGSFGWGGVWGTRFWVDPVGGITAVLLTNTTPEGVLGPLVEKVRDAIWMP